MFKLKASLLTLLLVAVTTMAAFVQENSAQIIRGGRAVKLQPITIQAQYPNLAKALEHDNFDVVLKELDQILFEQKEAAFIENEDLRVLSTYIMALDRLSRYDETEKFLEKVVETFPQNWRVLNQVAMMYDDELQHNGYIIAGKFYRGHNRRKDGGDFASCAERDRIRALQLMVQCLPSVKQDIDTLAAGKFYLDLANFLLNQRNTQISSWELQDLTDISKLPDYDRDNPWGRSYNPKGAAVNEDGSLVTFSIPESFDKAKNDGERWRWCLAQAGKINTGVFAGTDEFNAQAAFEAEADFRLASFCWGQFGVQTLRSYSFFSNDDDEDGEAVKEQAGIFSLENLPDTDSIAKLATGIKRFTLPEEFNYIKIFQKLAATPNHRQKQALEILARIMQNRRQYPRAVEYLNQWLATKDFYISEVIRQKTQLYAEHTDENYINQQLDQITGNLGRFERQPAQTPENPTVSFRFRNATSLTLTATRVDIDKLYADVQAEIDNLVKQSPIDNEKVRSMNRHRVRHSFGNIAGEILYGEEKTKYLTNDVQTWTHELTPEAGHKDATVTLPLPLKPGAYMLDAQLKDGNCSSMLVWITDTLIVHKNINGASWYYVVDALTGKEIANAEITAFGFREEWLHENRKKPQIKYKQKTVTGKTNTNGEWIVKEGKLDKQFQWMLSVVRPDSNKGVESAQKIAAFFGFGMVSTHCERYYDERYDEVHVFPVTDRPIYRPSQKVNFKFWCARSKYELDGEKLNEDSLFDNRKVILRVFDPNGEKILEQESKTDEFGACSGSYDLPADAKLGQYHISFATLKKWHKNQEEYGGGVSFRVEEYKKPEFEVNVEAPKTPVMLGEKIKATVEAKYYFGAPVTSGTAKIKVERKSHSQSWFASRAWDWLYGKGYWWTAYEANWLPGWSHWGCPRPTPRWWSGSRWEQPELVLEQDIELTEAMNGKIEVEFDTALAKAVHPDMDHSYTITAEVTDQSRRMISGTGNVLVARAPFKVYAWSDRGYYRVGDQIRMSFAAKTLDSKAVTGTGVLRVLEMSYDKDGNASEKELQVEEINPKEDGTLEYSLKATHAGQFRIAYTLTDDANHKIEGAELLTVTGDGFDGKDLRFSEIELIPDKAEYAPGETMKLMVNTNREGASVQLFIRCTNGTCMPPKLLTMTGKSQVVDVKIGNSDQPNFFIEALTVANAQVYTETREICVPPEKRILSMEIVPEKTEFLPGEKAKAKIRLTKADGTPFVGDTVVTVYDKALEYISGGSNIADIYPFFWNWKRDHHPETNVNTSPLQGSNLIPRDEKTMQILGEFGFIAMNQGLRMRNEMVMGVGGGRKMKAAPVMMAAPAINACMDCNDGMEADLACEDAMVCCEAAPEMPAMAMGAAKDELAGSLDGAAVDAGEASGKPLVQPTVRSNFADLAFWAASLHTDKNGEASIEFPMPENLTTWKICAWGLGKGTRVGKAETEVITRKNLIIRMQTPRFMTTSDEILLTANVHNYLATEKQVTVSITLPEGAPISLVDASEANVKRVVTIPANGESRIDWLVRANDEGSCKVQMSALTDEESDAMEMSFPIQIHGMMKQDARSEMIAADAPDGASAVMKFTVPEKRRPKDTRLEIRFSPTLAGAMIDALPYLADYPYGCTEQTLNRFLPSLLVQKALVQLGVSLEDVQNKTANLNAQEIGDAKQRAEQWRNIQPPAYEPVFDSEKLQDIVNTGAERLVNMQCSDGGWGWFSGFGEYSSPYLTAYVTRGLLLARQNDVAIPNGVIERGLAWLERYQNEQIGLLKRGEVEKPEWPYKSTADSLDAFVLFTLAQAGIQSDAMQTMSDYLFRDHTKLSYQANAILGLAWDQRGEVDRVREELKYLTQFVRMDEENQTAWIELPSGCCWWYWYDNEIETQAMYLRLLCATSDSTKYTSQFENLSHLDVAARMVKYLLNNRKHATYWSSTRDTALVLESMTQYLKTTNEMAADMTVEIWLDGKLVKGVEITSQNLFAIDNTFVISGEEVAAGEHVVELKRKGTGALYANGYASYFTLEDFIPKTGLEVKVDRKYYKLQRIEDATETRAGSRGQVVKENVEKFERIPLEVGAEVKSGDLIEVELAFESKNDYTFIMIEDMKPAGFETVDSRSGYNGNALGAYVELRDNRVVFFTRQLDHGIHSVSYKLRAEMPGTVSALPTKVEAMYAPEIKANSDEMKLKTVD